MKKQMLTMLVVIAMFGGLFVFAACGDPCKTAHVFGEYSTKTAATCTVDGNKEAKCKNCEEKDIQVVSATGHSGGAATCQAKATCSVCNEKYGEIGYHDLTHAEDRIVIHKGQGEMLFVIPHCHLCNEAMPQDSLSTFPTLNQLFIEQPALKVIYDPEVPTPGFTTMPANGNMEIGTATNARQLTIDGKAKKAVINGNITVVNGELIIDGNVEISGKIIVKGKLTIKEGATLHNLGEIIIEAGGVLANNGSVTGTQIVQK